MTYRLDAVLQKVTGPLVIVFPDGEELEFEDGPAAVRESFDRRYLIHTIHADGGTVRVVLREQSVPVVNWVGEEAVGAEGVSFF